MKSFYGGNLFMLQRIRYTHIVALDTGELIVKTVPRVDRASLGYVMSSMRTASGDEPPSRHPLPGHFYL